MLGKGRIPIRPYNARAGGFLEALGHDALYSRQRSAITKTAPSWSAPADGWSGCGRRQPRPGGWADNPTGSPPRGNGGVAPYPAGLSMGQRLRPVRRVLRRGRVQLREARRGPPGAGEGLRGRRRPATASGPSILWRRVRSATATRDYRSAWLGRNAPGTPAPARSHTGALRSRGVAW
jgi:hypothetical protein